MTDFALVEEGTSRVEIFVDGGTARRGLDGVWVVKPRSPDDIIMPDEIKDCRTAAADSSEFSALLQEALASLGEIPKRKRLAALDARPSPASDQPDHLTEALVRLLGGPVAAGKNGSVGRTED